MNITADTNLLVRVAVFDDPVQASLGEALLERAESVAVPISALCEFVWVLRRGYRKGRSEIAMAVRELLEAGKVRTDRAAAEAGLRALEAGGDFADGCIAMQGRRMGGTTFASFDRQAAAIVEATGGEALLIQASAPSGLP